MGFHHLYLPGFSVQLVLELLHRYFQAGPTNSGKDRIRTCDYRIITASALPIELPFLHIVFLGLYACEFMVLRRVQTMQDLRSVYYAHLLYCQLWRLMLHSNQLLYPYRFRNLYCYYTYSLSWNDLMCNPQPTHRFVQPYLPLERRQSC